MMHQSQFIEMFECQNSNYPRVDFKDICSIITDGEHATPKRSESGIYLLSARNILNHSLDLSKVDFIDEAEYTRIARRIIPQTDDILVSCSGSIGRVCIIPHDFKCQMVRSVALLRANNDMLPQFLAFQISMPFIQQQIELLQSKTSQANLFQGSIKKLKAILPDKDKQQVFIGIYNQADKSKFELKKSIEKIDNVIKALMQ